MLRNLIVRIKVTFLLLRLGLIGKAKAFYKTNNSYVKPYLDTMDVDLKLFEIGYILNNVLKKDPDYSYDYFKSLVTDEALFKQLGETKANVQKYKPSPSLKITDKVVLGKEKSMGSLIGRTKKQFRYNAKVALIDMFVDYMFADVSSARLKRAPVIDKRFDKLLSQFRMFNYSHEFSTGLRRNTVVVYFKLTKIEATLRNVWNKKIEQ